MMTENNFEEIIERALAEDIAGGDVTSSAIKVNKTNMSADIIAKEGGILCGINIAETVFKKVDTGLNVSRNFKDGDGIDDGDTIVTVNGSVKNILLAERTVLNFLSHLSGIATYTKKFADMIKTVNSSCDIYDTRKTLPGLRSLQKYAVRTGGGINHRFDLSEQVLIKENHIKLKDGGIVPLLDDMKTAEDKTVEVEVENIEQIKQIIDQDIDIVMLDNFNIEDMKEAVDLMRERNPGIIIEASGGITLETAAQIAATGVDRISSGSITNSSKSLDFSLLVK